MTDISLPSESAAPTVVDTNLSADEVYDRLPEVRCIDDDTLRSETIEAIARGTPDYFWEVEASASKRYHHPFARQTHGLWIHVKMVFTAFERIVDSYTQRDELTDYEADCCRAAILLHDMFKRGVEAENSTVGNHDILAATWLRLHTDLPREVYRAVEAHSGPWYQGDEPETTVEELVHVADMIASTSNISCGVYEPHEDITTKYPNIPRADL
jgi:hypothetical protein